MSVSSNLWTMQTKCAQGTHSLLVASFPKLRCSPLRPPARAPAKDLVLGGRRSPSSIPPFLLSVVVLENPPTVACSRSRRFVLRHHKGTRGIHKSREKGTLHRPCHRHENCNPIKRVEWGPQLLHVHNVRSICILCLKEQRVLTDRILSLFHN